jgi:hypothetical protein
MRGDKSYVVLQRPRVAPDNVLPLLRERVLSQRRGCAGRRYHDRLLERSAGIGVRTTRRVACGALRRSAIPSPRRAVP